MFKNIGLALGSKRAVAFDRAKLEDVHKHVLFICGAIESYLEYVYERQVLKFIFFVEVKLTLI